MRLGVSLNSAYLVDDPRAAARRMLERARTASAAGLDSLFVGDHHGVPVPYLQNTPVLGRILADWQGPTAGALFLLPLWHPTIVAEQLGTLAALTDSRIVLQCALGAGDQFAIVGQQTRDRVTRFEIGLDVVRRLLAGETLADEPTPWGPISGTISPVPDHRVDVWIGADVDAGHRPGRPARRRLVRQRAAAPGRAGGDLRPLPRPLRRPRSRHRPAAPSVGTCTWARTRPTSPGSSIRWWPPATGAWTRPRW